MIEWYNTTSERRRKFAEAILTAKNSVAIERDFTAIVKNMEINTARNIYKDKGPPSR